MKTFIICILVSLLSLSQGYCQPSRRYSQNIRIARPWGISFNIGSGNLLGISADYFPIPQLSTELGVGLTQYVALKYHFLGGNDNIKWSPFIGLAFCNPTVFQEYFSQYVFPAIPIGVHYIGEKGFSFSIAAATSFFYLDGDNQMKIYPWAGIRLGYHF